MPRLAAAGDPGPRLSGPFTHDNLTIYLVHGKSADGPVPLTLEEGLGKGKVKVHETGTVAELAIENLGEDDVLVHAGDIVKGGQQDRVLSFDLIVPPKSGKVPIQSFCVEQGRWSKRGGEDATKFDANPGNANGKAFKLAVFARKQDEVWAKVREAQMKLEKTVGQSVQSKDSPTSLQLTLEDKKLLERIDEYTKAVGKLTEGKKDVLGYVVAVNGKIDGADIYGSPVLFEKVWPRFMRGCAVDAVAEFEKDKKFAVPTVEAVRSFLREAETAKKETSRDLSQRVQVQTREGDRNVLIECKDKENGGQVIRRNYIAK
jgi:hypothetical protein